VYLARALWKVGKPLMLLSKEFLGMLQISNKMKLQQETLLHLTKKITLCGVLEQRSLPRRKTFRVDQSPLAISQGK
jgi:hypothetical protein